MESYALKHKIQEISSQIRSAGIDADGSEITNKDLINWAMQDMLMDKLDKVSSGLDDIRIGLYRGV